MYSIRFDELTVDFDGHFKLHGINWALGSNEHWAITGPNGSGKSALASVIAGEGQRERGLLTGVPKHVAIVSFEAQAALIESERKKDDADILDVVSEGTPVQEILDEDCADKGLQARLVSAMNIEYLLERSFRKLSSGETRKVLLIRAITSAPDLLILDEPYEGLDAQSFEFLTGFLAELGERTPMIMVLNRFDEIPSFVTHIAYTDNGELAHKVAVTNEVAVNDLRQLLHLKRRNYLFRQLTPSRRDRIWRRMSRSSE